MKYIISGVGPGESGVSRFLEYLILEKNEESNIFIYPGRHRSIMRVWRKNKIHGCIEIIKKISNLLLFKVRLLFILKNDVLLIHPQSIGYISFLYLVIVNKKVNVYVLDNSFFCIKSYNYRQGECIDCLYNSKKISNDCKSFPNRSPKMLSIIYLFLYRKLSRNIKFYCQNVNQANLVSKHFGKNLNELDIVGMVSADLIREAGIVSTSRESVTSDPNLIVFHGTNSNAKGFNIAVDLANVNKDYNFLFPFPKPVNRAFSSNCLFVDCNWESGLREFILKAKGILCLSGWSAPVEGALLKSLLLNGNVITWKTKYGFSTEISELMIQIDNTDVNLTSLFERNIQLKNNAKDWVLKYIEDYKYKVKKLLDE